MNIKQLKTMLISLDFHISPQYLKDTGVDWYAYKRTSNHAAECYCNDKTPSFVVTPYSFDTGSKVFQSAEFSITAESNKSMWVAFKVYGIQPEDVADKMAECEKMLVAAWNSVNV